MLRKSTLVKARTPARQATPAAKARTLARVRAVARPMAPNRLTSNLSLAQFDVEGWERLLPALFFTLTQVI
jgi:hypothetical protein